MVDLLSSAVLRFSLPFLQFLCSAWRTPYSFVPDPKILTSAGSQDRSMTGAFAPARRGLVIDRSRPAVCLETRGRVYSDIGVISAGLATKSMARAIIASTYIRQLRSRFPKGWLDLERGGEGKGGG